MTRTTDADIRISRNEWFGHEAKRSRTDLWCLLLGEVSEETGLGLLDVFGPLGVVGEEASEDVVLGHGDGGDGSAAEGVCREEARARERWQ